MDNYTSIFQRMNDKINDTLSSSKGFYGNLSFKTNTTLNIEVNVGTPLYSNYNEVFEESKYKPNRISTANVVNGGKVSVSGSNPHAIATSILTTPSNTAVVSETWSYKHSSQLSTELNMPYVLSYDSSVKYNNLNYSNDLALEYLKKLGIKFGSPRQKTTLTVAGTLVDKDPIVTWTDEDTQKQPQGTPVAK